MLGIEVPSLHGGHGHATAYTRIARSSQARSLMHGLGHWSLSIRQATVHSWAPLRRFHVLLPHGHIRTTPREDPVLS